jgi:ornithine carbamoyltransferase
MSRHFLTGQELSPAELNSLIERALELKAAPRSSNALAGRVVALLFELPSTRTRVSFEVGVIELGGDAVVLRGDELQLSRGESAHDTALVMSRHVDALGIRTGGHDVAEQLAAHASIPVINMLTVEHHPCQALADLLTLREVFGTLEGLKLAYVGDGNNVARSLAVLGAVAGIEVRIAAPVAYSLQEPVAEAILTDDPRTAVDGADAVYTDAWISMNDDPESAAHRIEALAPYRLEDPLLDQAAPHAVAMHCLPAHPGEEITAEVLYGHRQRIWQQAENRRHAQKALLEHIVVPAPLAVE